MFIVAKPFNSLQRRFKAGAPVAETDDLAPHNFADLKARGFIAPEKAKSETKFDTPAAPAKRATRE